MKKKILSVMSLMVLSCVGIYQMRASETEEPEITVEEKKTVTTETVPVKEVITKYGPRVVEAGKILLKGGSKEPSVVPEVVETVVDTTKDTTDLLGLDNFGAVNVQTGDIEIGDIKLVETKVTTCNQNVALKCVQGGSCNVTIGPCEYTQLQSKSLNAAPSELSFTRYLNSNQHATVSIRPGSNVPLYLTKQNNFTQIVSTTAQGQKVSYMIMLLPTNPTFVDKIKNLPKGLVNHLKSEKNNEDLIVKIYKQIGTSTVWEEIADQKVDVVYDEDFKLPMSQIIGNTKIAQDGSLVVTYYNVGDIPVLNVTYQPF